MLRRPFITLAALLSFSFLAVAQAQDAVVTPRDCSGSIATGGTAQNAFSAQGTLRGFIITNIDTSEVMWISFTGTAAAGTAGSFPLPPATATTFAGVASFTSPTSFRTNGAVSVVAATTGHKFSCVRW